MKSIDKNDNDEKLGELMPRTEELVCDYSIPEQHLKPQAFVFAGINATARMLDILAMLFSEMRELHWFKEDGREQTPEYNFTNEQLKQWFEIDSVETLSATLRAPAQRLSTTGVGIYDKEKSEFEYYPIFQAISYKKGVLRIKPNSELRDSYIINSTNNGFSLINNHLYLALKDTHSKRMLDMLSRFREEINGLHAISVKRLQQQFGVIGDKGKVLRKSYVSPYAFVRGIIKPALEKIHSSKEAKDIVEITRSPTGELGYELIDFDKANPKILFHCRWTKIYTPDQIEKAAAIALEYTNRANTLKKKGETIPLDLLIELSDALKIIGHTERARHLNERIAQIKKELAIKKELEKKSKSNSNLDKVSALLDQGFLDDL